MRTMLTLIALLSLTACGRDDQIITEYVRTTVTAPADEVQEVIDEVNQTRVTQGQLPLAQGLTCSLYANLSSSLTAFPTSLPAATYTWAYVGEVNQSDAGVGSGLNLLPLAVRTLYTQWFAVRCTGQLVIPESNYYSFYTRSDDASLLYLGGTSAGNLTVNNDGLHGPATVSGARYLTRGIHSLRLDYLQGPGGSQALQLGMNGKLIPANQLYR